MMSKGPGLLDFLAKASVTLPEEVVEVPEWGGRKVILRGWSSRERDEFEADNLKRSQLKSGNGAARRGVSVEADLTNFRARLVSRSIVEDGVRALASPQGEELLGNQPAMVLDRLFSICQRLHGMSDRDVEELTKNSPATVDADSSSDSLSDSAEPSLN